MCDHGEIESYQNDEFDGITEKVLQFGLLKEEEPSVSKSG
jgi:hypothetical protein